MNNGEDHMFIKEKGGFFLVVLALVLFGSYSTASASNISSELEVKEKITLYQLDNIEDLLKVGANEVTYYWTDLAGVNQSVDLVITVNEDGIFSVVEKDISSVEELNTIKDSIEKKDSGINIKATNYPDVPYKTNGGMTRSQFVNQHAFDRHKYDQNANSSCSRTRYERDIGVNSMRLSTIATADEKYSVANPASHVYIKRYGGRKMNMQIPSYGYTDYHRVIENYSDPSSSTHHPYCK